MEIGYLGPEGSYSHAASQIYAPEAIGIGMSSFSEIFEGVETERLDIGILPIENSTEGAVTAVMDGLLHRKKVKIIDELIYQIKHCLLSNSKTMDKIAYVLSHPQALGQCREFFARNYPQIGLIPCESSSQACITAKEKGETYGAIANKQAGEIYGLNVLNGKIQDNLFNQTRFIMIGRKDTEITGKDKTSIVFSFQDDYPGSLYSILREFADEDINLTRIESRPAKAEMGKYIFYIDFCGHYKEEKVNRILQRIEKLTSWIKILGSYPFGSLRE
ncbi:MAG: prephenate dehydratase [Thermotaleaceae bacterium]